MDSPLARENFGLGSKVYTVTQDPIPCTNVIKVTSPNVATSSIVIVETLEGCKGFIIWNNSSNSAYVTFGPASNSAAPSIIIAAFSPWVWPFNFMYIGKISAIRNAGSGTMTTTKFYYP